MVNVLQAMILTNNKGEMILTPTYHVFKMYNVHQDAIFLPFELNSEKMNVRDNRSVPLVSGTASRDKNGVIHISLSNVDADSKQEVTVNLQGVSMKSVTGQILTSKNLTDHNTFENPDVVKLAPFNGAKISKGVLTVKLPAKSIVTLAIR